ncbi:MAG: drug/metabolite transporter (DMT)-like permease [Candidatus Midichloriaceae bacterium]|jgi:drug/metabolite transporter (DMT)-like permease
MISGGGNTIKYTLIGSLSLLFWAISATFVVTLKHIPTYEMLSFVFFIGLIFCILYNSTFNHWNKLKNHPPYIWICGIIGICGNEIFFVFSFKNAPAAHADLINYLWPILVILFTPLLPKEKFNVKYIISAVIAFIAVIILIIEQNDITSLTEIKHEYLIGYLCAFCAALFWTVYTLVSKFYGKLTPEMIVVYCGFGFIISTSLHIYFENFVIPTAFDFLILFLMGVGTHCFAYFFWDLGIKKGDIKLLTILSYASPIISISILILLGLVQPSIILLFSAILVFLSGFIGGIKIK